jgi:hypothetical protein
VDDADALEAEAAGFEQVLFDDGAHLARRDGVQVEHVPYLQTHRLGERVEGVNVRLFLIRERFRPRACAEELLELRQ